MSTSVRVNILNELESNGFVRGLGGVFSESEEVILVVDPNISRKTGQFSLSAGLWIKALGDKAPKNYWGCHIYGSAGHLLPSLGEYVQAIQPLIGSDDDREAVHKVTSLLASRSRLLMTLCGVRAAFLRGDFRSCMIVKEARSFLEVAEGGPFS